MRKCVLIFLLFFASVLACQNSFAYSSSVPRSLPFVHNGNIYTDTLSYSNEAGTWNLYVTDGSMVKCQKANYDWTEYWGYTGAVTYIECYTTGTGGSFTLSYETFDTSGNLVDSYWDYTQSNGSAMMFMATNLVHYPFSSDQLAFSRDIYNVAGDTVVFGANVSAAQFLNFPILYDLNGSSFTAYTAPVSSVMDYSMPNGPYSENGVILAFNGEQGNRANGYHLGCYANTGNTAFDMGLHYVGTSSTGGGYYLCYDGHPGYDYPFDQGTYINTPEAGTLCVATTYTATRSPVDVWRNTSQCPLPSVITERWLDTGGFNAFYILHSGLHINGSANDYLTVFLHSDNLESSVRTAVETNGYATVGRNQHIAQVGDVGAPGAYHMHLEVYKKNTSTGNWERVDPYGDGTNNILWPH